MSISDKCTNFSVSSCFTDKYQDGDKTNREGHAAKVYFNSLFGKKFTRNDDNNINAALNYGYSILLSTINKEISANGYLTQLGIHHKNEFKSKNTIALITLSLIINKPSIFFWIIHRV